MQPRHQRHRQKRPGLSGRETSSAPGFPRNAAGGKRGETSGGRTSRGGIAEYNGGSGRGAGGGRKKSDMLVALYGNGDGIYIVDINAVYLHQVGLSAELYTLTKSVLNTVRY